MNIPQINSHGRGRAIIVVLMIAVPLAFSVLAGAYVNHPDCRTGAPGEGTCQNCHDEYGLNSGDGYISLSGLSESYEPGKSYIVTVTVCDPGMTRFCFELTIVSSDSGQPTGSFTCIDTSETCVSGGGKYLKTTRYGMDDSSNSMKTWQFQWNSPSKAEAPLTFYGVGMGSDADNDENGDCTYTCMMTLQPGAGTPVKPVGLIVEPSDGAVSLSWYMPTQPEPAGGQIQYNIYWSDSATGGFELLDTSSVKEFTHTGLVNGHTYRYQISCSNGEGEGPLSDVVNAVPANVPDRPRYLTTSKVAFDQISLTWDAPSSWGDGGSRTFTVCRGEEPWDVAPIATGVNTGSYTDNGPLEPNVTYYYRVQAVTDSGAGGVVCLSVYVPPTTPGFPLDLSVMVKKATVELVWQPPMQDGGDAVRSYRVYRSESGKASILLIDHLTTCEFVDNSVNHDVTYEYTVAAVNSAGEGSLSTPVEAYVVPPPSVGDDDGAVNSQIPFSGLVVVGAIILIGALMVGRLSRATNEAERADRD
jgi:fibronectin type 3 domain-containing protein